MQTRSLIALGLAASLLAACNSAEEAAPVDTPVAEPTPVLTSTPTPTVAPDGSPLALGSWAITENGTGASAGFGPADAPALLLIACDAASKTLTLSISNATPGNQSFAVEAGGAAARLDMMSDGNAVAPRQSAAIAIDAPVFGGFVVPGGVIEISQPGGATLRVPSAAGIRRVFEACQ